MERSLFLTIQVCLEVGSAEDLAAVQQAAAARRHWRRPVQLVLLLRVPEQRGSGNVSGIICSAALAQRSDAARSLHVQPPVLRDRVREGARDGAGEDAAHDALGRGQARIAGAEVHALALHLLRLPPLHACRKHM